MYVYIYIYNVYIPVVYEYIPYIVITQWFMKSSSWDKAIWAVFNGPLVDDDYRGSYYIHTIYYYLSIYLSIYIYKYTYKYTYIYIPIYSGVVAQWYIWGPHQKWTGNPVLDQPVMKWQVEQTDKYLHIVA